MRFLAIDLGEKRTGLALGDALTRIATPLDVIEIPLARRDGAAVIAEVVRAALDAGARALVIGLPLNMDGTEGPRSNRTRALAALIAKAANLPLHFQDERLSTARADWSMARTGLTRGQKKAKRDALAAAAILSDFLANLGPAAE